MFNLKERLSSVNEEDKGKLKATILGWLISIGLVSMISADIKTIERPLPLIQDGTNIVDRYMEQVTIEYFNHNDVNFETNHQEYIYTIRLPYALEQTIDNKEEDNPELLDLKFKFLELSNKLSQMVSGTGKVIVIKLVSFMDSERVILEIANGNILTGEL